MIHVELMIFDFDGTLVSSGEDLSNAVNHTLQALNLPERSEREILGFIGDGVDTLMTRALGPAAPDRFAEAMRIFKPYYEAHMLDRTVLYPGVRRVLDHFPGKKKLIVTNKLHQLTVKIAGQLGILSDFDEIIGRDRCKYVKPDSRLLAALMERYAIAADRTVVIGDGANDLIMAKGAGAWSCAHLNGLTARALLMPYQPDFTYEAIDELANLFS